MKNTQYLIFGLYGSRYAVGVHSILEVLLLPELTPVTDAPAYVTGMFNYRGRVIPVMDLHVRLGYRPRAYSVIDRIIVMENGESAMALLVNDVFSVLDISPELLEAPPNYPDADGHGFVEGTARLDENIVTLLDFRALMESSPILRNLYRDERDMEEVEQVKTTYDIEDHPVFMPDISADEREVLHGRALKLIGEQRARETSGELPVAAIKLHGEYYAVELAVVLEFASVREITPVPCVPPRVTGLMNLRGDIITVVDLSGKLGLPFIKGDLSEKKVIILNEKDLHAGILVDEVLDVLYVPSEDVSPAPDGDYLKWTYPYGDRMLGLLDLRRLVAEGELVVNESV